MSVFRPSNVNKRLVGTATTINGSPGNGGQIGRKKTPYNGGNPNRTCNIDLGDMCKFGCCGGVFKANESRCGRREDCQCTLIDCAGFFICCGPSTEKWFVAPSCTEVNRCWNCREDAVTLANSCQGCCGWFIPTCDQLKNPGYSCRTYWDCLSGVKYLSSTEAYGHFAWSVCMGNGNGSAQGDPNKNIPLCARAFRCTAS